MPQDLDRIIAALPYCVGKRVVALGEIRPAAVRLLRAVADDFIVAPVFADSTGDADCKTVPERHGRTRPVAEISVTDGSVGVVFWCACNERSSHKQLLSEAQRILAKDGLLIIDLPPAPDPAGKTEAQADSVQDDVILSVRAAFGHVEILPADVGGDDAASARRGRIAFASSVPVPLDHADSSPVRGRKPFNGRGQLATQVLLMNQGLPADSLDGDLLESRRQRARRVELERELVGCRAKLHQREIELMLLRQSTSWRVTGPLRAVKTAILRRHDVSAAVRRLTRRVVQSLAQDGIRRTIARIAMALRQHKILELFGYANTNSSIGIIRRTKELYQPYEVAGTSPAGRLLRPHVLIVGELGLAQCTKYRVLQKQRMFETLGVHCTVIDWGRKAEVRTLLQTHSLVIFYRVPGYDDVLGLIKEARRLNVPSIWEVDDLIFDMDAYLANGNIHLLNEELRRSVLYGVPLYLAALRACEFAIASTRVLADAMISAGAKKAFVIENGLDDDTLRIADGLRAKSSKAKCDEVVIAYGSGSKAHDADFRVAAPAILDLLRTRPNVRLHIIGDLNLPSEFEAFDSQIELFPVSNYASYLKLLSQADINLAPLEPSLFNDAKSNIKFLEASILGIPSVCSPRDAFRIVQAGTSGYLADNFAEWHQALTVLVDNPGLRRSVGEEARSRVIERYSCNAIANRQVLPMLEVFSNTRPARLRVLAVNVYFCPQSFGGATIVAEQIALRLNGRSDTEVVVFTSWGDLSAAPYDLYRYEANGLPVIAVRMPDMDSREIEYYNARIGDIFTDVLNAIQPDIVHFHSVQGLGVALADACRRMNIPYAITLHDAWWLCERQFMVNGEGRYCFQTIISADICANCVADALVAEKRRAVLADTLANAALLLTPSEFQRQLYVANGVNQDKIKVNKNGIKFPTEPLKRAQSDRIRFGFVGGGGAIKGEPLIKRAFEDIKYRNYELTLVDNTMNLGFSSVGNIGWRITGEVRAVPAYTQDTMDEFFEQIDVLLFPSQWKESFGLTVREALARDVWVIATDSGGVTEDIVPGENGTIIPLDGRYEPLRDEIVRLLENPHLLANYSNRHKQRITDFDAQARELRDLLATAMA